MKCICEFHTLSCIIISRHIVLSTEAEILVKSLPSVLQSYCSVVECDTSCMKALAISLNLMC